MKRLMIIGQMLLLVIAFIGCSPTQDNHLKYDVLIIQGDENISGKFGEFGSSEYPIHQIEYITNLELAKEKYPKYEIKKVPAVFIFETAGGEMKKLKLETYDVDQAIEFLKESKK
ncbi:hypothetical protein [Litchfieldia salsa]|uniref:Thioredoxin domain-containing protein n=1 Tax=Litchfieldia salsa TaxID=930152 RepID=A0A1H0X0T9_9BACI|nr:hypothetical protein [Litchfieldia salsa]SDP96567.1 hypothetical protein SAMN05216565_1223 [Litchfieldia salsa]